MRNEKVIDIGIKGFIGGSVDVISIQLLLFYILILPLITLWNLF